MATPNRFFEWFSNNNKKRVSPIKWGRKLKNAGPHLATQKLVRTEVRKLIGDECNTHVFSNPWLPDDVNPFVTTPISDCLSNILVSSLIQQEVLAWDNDILSNLFNDRDADIIRGDSLSFLETRGQMVMVNRRGVYSVRSSYKFLLQASRLGPPVFGVSFGSLKFLQR